jgi:hypothetical protein
VDSIWLDNQCNINFRLKNAGKGSIPDGEHRESVVRVQFGSEIKDLPLGRIDLNGALKKAGGLVSFNTQIILKSPTDVKVIVDFNKKIRETEDGEKKNEVVSKLTPQCQSVAMAGVKTKTLAREGAKTDTPLQKTPWQIGTPLSQGSGTKSDTAPIKISILSPTQNSSWDIGSNLNIQWKALPLPKAFHVLLFSKPNDTMAEAIISQFKTFKPNQQGIFSETWKIPSYIKSGGYVVKIIYVDDPSEWTTSDFFKIEGGGPSLITPKPLYAGPPVKGFKVDYPDKTDLWVVGESHNIVWSYLSSVLNDAKAYGDITDNVRIVLKDGSGAQRLIISQSAKNQKPIYPETWSPPSPNTTSSSMWTIPKDLTDGKYVIRIETMDGHFFGESELKKILKADKTETANILQ